MKFLFLLLSFLTLGALSAQETLPPALKLRQDGTFEINGIHFLWSVGDRKWRFQSNQTLQDRVSEIRKTGAKISGTILPGTGKGAVAERLAPVSAQSFDLDFALTMEKPVPLNRISCDFLLPADTSRIEMDGKSVAIPPEPGKDIRLYSGGVKTATLRPAGARELEIKVLDGGRIIVQDNRKFRSGENKVCVMFCATKEKRLKLRLTIRDLKTQAVPLERFINRAYSDYEGNRLPVWTLQGPEESLFMFQPGKHRLLGIPFLTSQKGAVATGGTQRGGVPSSLTIPVTPDIPVRSLNLLHTSAWTPYGTFGTVTIRFADGTEKTYPVSGRYDCGNWVSPRPKANAYVAWSGERADNSVGAYLSTFPVPAGRKPVSLTFSTNNDTVIWFIMGITFAEKEITLPGRKDHPVKIRAGKEWHPLAFRNNTVPDSPLDFSSQLDAPAGKYGFARPNPDGTLRFEKAPERILKLYGTNFCMSVNFPPKEEAGRIADQIARNGYNSVRFHHHDNGLVDPESPDSVTLNAENLDRFEYFFAELKKRGIYVTTDCYSSRKFKKGDGVPTMKNEKGLFQIGEPSAVANLKNFLRNWLTHRNPYTGLTLAEDPALVFVNLINEDDPLNYWYREKEVRELHIKAFEEWKKTNRCPDAVADTGDRRFLDFLFEQKAKTLSELSRFVKEELKLQASVTSQNQHQGQHFTLLRSQFDVVDDHGYHDHRATVTINGRSGNSHSQTSAVMTLAYMPRMMMTSRNPAKPFFMTEFNHCRPNRFRAESGPMMGAYCALQGWSGFYRFCYAHSISRVLNNSPANSCFDSVADPVMQFSDRIIAAMFLRGDVRRAPTGFSFEVPADVLKTDAPLNFPLNFQMLGYLVRIGSHKAGTVLPPGIRAVNSRFGYAESGGLAQAWKTLIEKKQAISSTGEIRIDARNNQLVVRTPRTESLTFSRGELSAGVLSVKEMSVFGTVAAISLDRKPLPESGSILLLHLTDTANSGDTFHDSERKYVDRYGKLPLLVRRGKAQVTLNLKAPFRVRALSADGDPLGSVRTQGNTFTIATDLFPQGVMAYHITR